MTLSYENDARAAKNFEELKEVVVKIAEEIDDNNCGSKLEERVEKLEYNINSEYDFGDDINDLRTRIDNLEDQ